MKKTHYTSPEVEKIEFNCKCCEALGIADIIREMIEKDLRKDLEIENRKLRNNNKDKKIKKIDNKKI